MSKPAETMAYHMKAVGVPTPKREYRFHPVRRWRFDFAWPDQRLALEVEGGTWIRGRHSRGKGYEGDCEKYAEAVLCGWRVLRVTSSMVEDGRALQLVERAFGMESPKVLREAGLL